MLAAIPFPDLSPEIFSIELFGRPFALRWYALAYIAGILIGWRILTFLARRPDLWGGVAPFDARQAEGYITYVVIGIILGGRIGYVLAYEPGQYFADPWTILQIWNGGLSFHGGFLGVVVVTLLFSWREKVRLSAMADAVALAAPPGLFLGRLANFVNAELWGHETAVPWGVIFPGEAAQTCGELIGVCARHPSQLYEAALEGLLLGLVLFWLVTRRQWLMRPWRSVGVFLIGYGLARSFVELFRQADSQFTTVGNPYGYFIHFGEYGLSMGQVLSLPMVVVGLWLILRKSRVAP